MNTLIRESTHIARKQYDCAACEWLTNSDIFDYPEYYEVSFTDMRTLVKIRNEKYTIFKGEKYIRQVGIFEGYFYSVPVRIDARELCIKYDMFDD